MEQRRPEIVLPIVAAFVGLVGIVGVATYYGSQQITPQFKISLSRTAAVAAVDQNELTPFSQDTYDEAIGENKVILLYFTASWCPECDYAKMRLAQVAADWPSDKVVVFVSDLGTTLAENFGVVAPDTKIILRGGKILAQSTEMWSLERFQEEILAIIK